MTWLLDKIQSVHFGGRKGVGRSVRLLGHKLSGNFCGNIFHEPDGAAIGPKSNSGSAPIFAGCLADHVEEARRSASPSTTRSKLQSCP
jgi:hypothetical protein